MFGLCLYFDSKFASFLKGLSVLKKLLIVGMFIVEFDGTIEQIQIQNAEVT